MEIESPGNVGSAQSGAEMSHYADSCCNEMKGCLIKVIVTDSVQIAVPLFFQSDFFLKKK